MEVLTTARDIRAVTLAANPAAMRTRRRQMGVSCVCVNHS